MNRLVLCLAQGFYIGRIPFAPGTLGSMLGLGWFALLVATGHFWSYALGCGAGIAVSIWSCGRAEKILGRTDPGSVVMDEVAALPLCFASWLWLSRWEHGTLPDASFFFRQPTWIGTVVLFAAFRLFDIWKPWPVRQSQALPGGWGVTIDDVLAAVYVNLCVLVGVEAALRLKH
jgi:phosphatidylglycerophosphatase A